MQLPMLAEVRMSLGLKEMLSEGNAKQNWLRAVLSAHQISVYFWICCGQYAQRNDATDLEHLDKSVL